MITGFGAEGAQRDKRAVLTRLRHELRTPLNAIIGYSEMLLEDAEDRDWPEAAQNLHKIRRAGADLLALVGDLLNPEKIEAELDHLELDSFGAALRRELLTPLASVTGLSELLLQDAHFSESEEFTEDLVRIRTAASDFAAFLKDLGELRLYEEEGFDAQSAVSTMVQEVWGALSAPGEGGREAPPEERACILVVDDLEVNRDLLLRRLTRRGHIVVLASGGQEALDLLAAQPFDLVLLDIMMPGLNGYQVLARIKGSPEWRHIPVIMISALDEMESVVRCVKLGAEDYLPKPFDPVLLQARIGACLEKKRLRDKEKEHLATIQAILSQLNNELAEAANYVRKILPLPLREGPIRTRWRYAPSASLGGDAFGYHWLDRRRFALYLIDVSGHGVGAALLSVSIINVLRRESLASADFTRPAEVLRQLNRAFPMEENNDMYFTMWYGVYDVEAGVLSYSSAGHPPALFFENRPGGPALSAELQTPNMFIGGLEELEFGAGEFRVERPGRLFVFCDGVFEVTRQDGSTGTLEDLKNFLTRECREAGDVLERLHGQVAAACADRPLDDDFSILEVEFL